ncbi:DNA-binding protein [Variovorax sp. HJSM1_2]|uniref:DNA-binding protein n=1 Tax=Variovorax sp. HJSM1_2 TaxID=3366263 RepID=UPI003BCC7EF6
MSTEDISPERIAEVRAWFASNGVSYSDWAASHGIERSTVYAVLSGKSRCRRGESHRVALLLGLRQKVASNLSLQPFPEH